MWQRFDANLEDIAGFCNNGILYLEERLLYPAVTEIPFLVVPY